MNKQGYMMVYYKVPLHKQDSSVPRHTIYQMARLFSLAGAVTVGNIIHDYTAV